MLCIVFKVPPDIVGSQYEKLIIQNLDVMLDIIGNYHRHTSIPAHQMCIRDRLKLPRYVKEQYIKSKNIPYTQSTDLEAVMPELDILYMTRVQRERFFNEEDYLRLKDCLLYTSRCV